MNIHEIWLHSNAALTTRRISLQIWKFETRGKIAENDMIGWEKYWKKEGIMNVIQMRTNSCEYFRIHYK